MTAAVPWARRLARRFATRRILVVGDLMLDRYLYGSVHRISPEAPVPVLRVRAESDMPGGAANVARNVRALGAHTFLCGALGRDEAGRAVVSSLRRAGVHTGAVLLLPGRRTAVKMRVLADRQQVVRVDWEGPLRMAPAARRRFCDRLAAAVPRMDGIIISDYAKGTVNQEVMDLLMEAARRHGVPVALDPKDHGPRVPPGVTVITPNRREAFVMARLPESPPREHPLDDKPLLRAASALLRAWQPTCLVVTLGAQGMLLLRAGARPQHVPAVAREVFDVSGAGDTVIAALLLALSAGVEIGRAAELANCAAGVVVAKVGTATCSRPELLASLERLPAPG